MTLVTSKFVASWCRLVTTIATLISAVSAQTAWITSDRVGDETRFLYGNQVQRYDVGTRTWQPPRPLPRSGATAMATGGGNSYVAYGAVIYRYNADFTDEALLGTASSAIQSLFLDDDVLIAVHSTGWHGRLTTYHRLTGLQLSTRETYVDSLYGASHAPGINRIYGRTQGISPAKIVSCSYGDAGPSAVSVGSFPHGDHPDEGRTWVFPGEGRMVDSTGTVHAADGLAYGGSFSGTVTDIAFNGDMPVVLRGSEVIGFNKALVETGRTPTGTTNGAKIQIAGNDALVFSPGTTVVKVVPLASLNAPEPGTPINPVELAYTADDAFQDENGDLLLFSKAMMSLFRWSPAERRYTGSFPLVGIPEFAAYAKTGKAAYLAYNSGVVRRMDFTQATPQETVLFNLPSTPLGLAAAGDLVLSQDGSGAWGTHHVHSPAGAPLGSMDRNYHSKVWEWEPVKRRMYFFRDDSSPNDLRWESIGPDGKITAEGETAYHGDFSAPIRAKADGSKIVIGSGGIFETAGMTQAGALANGFNDAVWVGDRLFSIRLINGITQLQSWQGTPMTAGPVAREFKGTPVRIVSTGSGLLVVTSQDGAPRFILLNDSFETLHLSPVRPVAPANLAVTARDPQSVSLRWNDLSDNEEEFRIDYRIGSGNWVEGATAPENATSATVTGLAPNTVHDFRVVARVTTLESTPSTIVTARTTSSPDQPVGEPYLLAITRIFHNRITLEWQDNAGNETGFRILRSTTANGTPVVLTAAANARSFTDTGLRANTTYHYRVQAANSDIGGDLSSQVNGTTLPSAYPPMTPLTLTAAASGPTAITLKWTESSTNEDGFIIERSGSPATTWTEVARVGFNVRTYADTTVMPNSTYNYRVRAWNTAGDSSNTTTNSGGAVTTPKSGGEFAGLSIRTNNRYHFAFSGPDRIERYDLAARQWLAPIPLNAPATALWADEAGIYVAEDHVVIRFSPDGGSRTRLADSESTVNGIFTLGGTLVFQNSGFLTSLDKATGALLTAFRKPRIVYGNQFVTHGRRAYFRTSHGIGFLDIDPGGKLLESAESPANSPFSSINQLFIFPDGSRVAGDSGAIFDTGTLALESSIGTPFTDLSFRDNHLPVVLRGNRLVACDDALSETGSATLPSAGLRMAVDGDDALVFTVDGQNPRGLAVQAIPLSSLAPALAGTPVDPHGLAFTPDDVFMDRDGTLLLFSKAWHSLFRWSPATKGYLPTLPLLGAPAYAAYSPESHTAYLAYGSQILSKLDLSATAPSETPIVNLITAPTGLTSAGGFVYAVSNGKNTYSPNGTLLSHISTNNDFSDHDVWDPIKRRVYHFRTGVYPDALQWDAIGIDGKLNGAGGTSGFPTPVAKPIRVKPDGSQIVIGSGVVFAADGLTKLATLANGFTDAAWQGGRLVTARPANGGAQLQTWQGTQFAPGAATRQVSGTPVRLLAVDDERLLLVTIVEGVPRFTLFDAALKPLYASPTTPPPPLAPAVTSRTKSSVSLSWTNGSDNEDGFTVEYRIGTGAWQPGANVPAGTTSATVTGLAAGILHEFRVVAAWAEVRSAPSATVAALTLTGDDQPAGEPYELRVTGRFNDSITLEWQDNARNETGFRVLRYTTAAGTPVVLTAAANARSFTDSGLPANTTYYYRIQTINGNVPGDLSAQVNARTLSSAGAPAPPLYLSAIATSPTSVFLTWEDNSTNENGVIIERTLYLTNTWTEVARVGPNVRSYADPAVMPDSTYSYRVRAWNMAGNSENAGTSITTPKTGDGFAGLSIRSGNRYYFAFTGPNRIERYDLAARTWLAPVPLNAAPTALWVDEAGIYVAEDRAVVRFSPDGGNRTEMGRGETLVNRIVTLGGTLVFQNNATLTSLDKATGRFLATFESPVLAYNGNGHSVTHGRRVLFPVERGVGFLEIGADGTLLNSGKTPANGALWCGKRLFTFPGGSRIAGDSGRVFDTRTLSYNISLAYEITDLSFHGSDIPVVLRGNRLLYYTNTLLEAGSYTLATDGLRVAVESNDALVFIADSTTGHGLRVQTVPLNQITTPEPGPPADARGLGFWPDDVFVDHNGDLLFFSTSQSSLFRWSPATKDYLPAIPLLGAPTHAAYSKVHNAVYLAYSTKSLLVHKLDLTSSPPLETPLFSLASGATGLAAAGDFIFASDSSREGTHYLFSSSGTQIHARDWNNEYSLAWEWDPVMRRVYCFQDYLNNLLWESISLDGRITGSGESPYNHSVPLEVPIRVSPDGGKVVIGNGLVFETAAMTRFATMANSFRDAVWTGTELLTIRSSGTQTELQRWNATTFTRLGGGTVFPGNPVRLMAMDDGTFALITHDRGMPRIQILGADLALTYDYVPDAPRVTGTPPPAVEDTLFSWQPELWQAKGSGPLTLTAPVLPSWLTLSAGVLRGTPAEVDSGDQVERSKTHRIVLEVRDGAGRSEQREFFVTAAWRNDAPSLPAFEPVRANDRGEPTDTAFGPLVIDPDGRDVHRWTLTGNTNLGLFSSVSLSENGRLQLAYTPYVDGDARLTLQVADASGASASRELEVILPKLPAPKVEVDPTITLNRATGLYDQKVVVTNVAARAIFGFDLDVSGLGDQVKLYNGATSVAGGGTFQYRSVIEAGGQVHLVLSYHALIRGNVQQPSVTPAVAYPPQGGDHHTSTTTGPAAFAIDWLNLLADGSVKLRFPAEPGVSYRVQSSGDLKAWETVSEVLTTGAAGVIEWVETARTAKDNQPATSRFYRIERVSP